MRILRLLSIGTVICPLVLPIAASAGQHVTTTLPGGADGLAAHAPGQIVVGLREGADIRVTLEAVRLKTSVARAAADRSGAIARVRTSGAFPRDRDGRIRVAGRAYADLSKVPDDVMFGEAYAIMDEPERRLYRSHVVSLPAGTDLRDALAALQADADVDYAEPNYLATTSFVPNDPQYDQQWAHQNTDAEAGWNIETGNPSTIIAIIDSGVAYAHPDLAANIWHDSGGDPGFDFVDIDTSLYVDAGFTLVAGEDYVGYDIDPSDALGHGTHVAGIAAAVGSNAVGVSGVCQHCSLMVVRAGFAIDAGSLTIGAFESDDLANAISYAASSGARIISMSLGGSGVAQVVKDAVDYAVFVKGTLVVAAAGNSNLDQEQYPAALDGVLGVAATAIDDTRAYYSTLGRGWMSPRPAAIRRRTR